ncbi:aromatic amino acid aminotransferase [Coniochaeta sp. 2T2.1]|nr:aromatic amino acid aminotransferase [Coniochaeta sp. 2T2.1]
MDPHPLYRHGSFATKAPKPLDLSHHFSDVSKHRVPSKMKEYYKFFAIPGIGNLAGGLPNVSFFPFDTLEAQAAKPERWLPTPNHPGDSDESVLSSKLASTKLSSDPTAATHIGVPKAIKESNPLKKVDLESALQYGTAEGYPPLHSWIRQFTREHLHPNVPYEGGPEVILTVGSTDGMSKSLELFINPWIPGRDDPRDRPGLLCENFVYGNVLTQAAPKGVAIVAIEADEGGMVVSGKGGLEDVLANWDYANGKRPNLMYTVTMGHNPTGIVLSLERRKEIYAVCSRYDVIIIEDDPYWYLQFPSAETGEAASRGLPAPEPKQPFKPAKSSGFPYLDSLVPSFLSIDIDGRVVRLDTFSKTIAPGCRLGWITAQPGLVANYLRIAETSTQQPSGFVQSMVAELVMGRDSSSSSSSNSDARKTFLSLRSNKDRAEFTGWKVDGWVRWLEGLRGQYERRMNRMCQILDEGSFQLKTGAFANSSSDSDWGVVTKTQLYDFAWPRGGMFVWMRMYFERHPLWQAPRSDGKGILDGPTMSMALMMMLTRKNYLVLISPGMMFSANEKVRQEIGWAYYRLCFAAETEERIDLCSEKFVTGVQKFWRIKDARVIEELVEDLPIAAAEEEEDLYANLGMPFGC